MNSRTIGAALLLSALALGACAEQEQTEGTSDLSRDLLAQPAGDGTSTPIPTDATLDNADAPRVRVSEVGIDRGSVDAPVKVVEMSDYGCGYCRMFHDETFPSLLDEFIDTGMVEWKFVPYITGMFGNSLPATEAAECAIAQSREQFELLNNRIWDEQAAWKGASDPAAVIRPWVEELDLDMAAFDTCLNDDERIERIASATTLARQLGVRGTPTFVVLGYAPLQGALPLETFRQLLTAVHTDLTRDPSADVQGDEGAGNE
ncbi:MAG: thioredoxin domain-containing protein [Gemmatimonadota bacterium]